MQVEIRYFDGCPHWESARTLVEEVASTIDLDIDLRLTPVTDPETSERLTFRGSPTILIDGVDPWDDPLAPVGLSCRVYRSGDGYGGTPPIDELRSALLGGLTR